jgi:two-component system, NtrC family, sensor histidine kinase GlrK
MSLFSRLTLGYLTIFLLVAAVSAYAIYQLHQFNELTHAILEVDNRILSHEKILADLLFSQSRYEQKFTISQDQTLHKEFLRLKEEFDVQLKKALALGDPMAGPVLANIQHDYRSYEGLVGKEVQLLMANQVYPQEQYKQEKAKIVDSILSSLQKLRQDKQQATHVKVNRLAQSSDQARRVSVIIAAVSLLAVLLLSGLITRSITGPLSLLKNKTREIAQGRFETGLDVTSPPEIGELATAFNVMCEKLNELDRMKADFFSSMSHELRTPLTSIKEGTGLLLANVGGETTEKQRRLLTILAEESNRLIGVVNSLLDLSKMEAGMMKYDFVMSNPSLLVKQVINETLPLVEAKQITLNSALDANLPTVRLDPERVLQVLRNLVGNAVKFTPRGGQVTLGATFAHGMLKVHVQDSGPGIPADNLTTIFDKFHQGSPKGLYTSRGTGLGLAIAREIITSHGGKIWVESQLGRGSTFFFVLPC